MPKAKTKRKPKSQTGVSALRKITKEAKRMKAMPKNKGKKWTTLVKKAAAKYRAGKL